MKKILCFLFTLFIFSSSAFSKSLEIDINLPVSEQNQALINVVALENGWDPNGLYDSPIGQAKRIPAMVYISEYILKPDFKKYFVDRIMTAHEKHYGSSGEQYRQKIKDDIESNLQITVSFSE